MNMKGDPFVRRQATDLKLDEDARLGLRQGCLARILTVGPDENGRRGLAHARAQGDRKASTYHQKHRGVLHVDIPPVPIHTRIKRWQSRGVPAFQSAAASSARIEMRNAIGMGPPVLVGPLQL
jgi:hypothetical protein